MHPIERLRYLARVTGVPPKVLVRETAAAFSALGYDQAELLTACRRVLDRHPVSGPMWWLSARVLTAIDAEDEAWRCAEEIVADATADVCSYDLPDEGTVAVVGWPDVGAELVARRGDLEVLVVEGHADDGALADELVKVDVDAEAVPASGLGAAVAAADLVVVEATAYAVGGVVAPAGSLAAAAVARTTDTTVWLAAGVGRGLSPLLWQALEGRRTRSGPGWELGIDTLDWSLVDQVATPIGLLAPDAAIEAIECPDAPELARAAR